ncbi:MAG: hypothetical protein CME57_02625 [Halieaceae bacterium]|nr:hypothetical protein [Halieaceae bacterium]
MVGQFSTDHSAPHAAAGENSRASGLGKETGQTPKQKKPAVTQPAMKEPLKTGRDYVKSPPLLRRFPCEVPVDNAISTTNHLTRTSEKSSKKVEVF